MSTDVNRELLKKSRLGAMEGDKGVRSLVSEVLKIQGASGLNYTEKPYSRTALMEAVWFNIEPAWRLLLEKGAATKPQDYEGLSALHIAARFGHLNAAEALIERGADMNAIDNEGQTPLHLAAANMKREVAALLIARGAKVNALDNDKVTCAHMAAFNGEREFAQWLFNNGATNHHFGIKQE